jgi:hypothetical protein
MHLAQRPARPWRPLYTELNGKPVRPGSPGSRRHERDEVSGGAPIGTTSSAIAAWITPALVCSRRA